nr:MAG TPA: immunity protein [Caudoviricetes sp.]
MGVWSAIRLVNTYENDNFGEVTTAIEPCRIANMLVYIYGEYLLNQVAYLQGDKWDEELTEEDLNIIVEQVEEWLELNLPTESDRYSKREFDGQVWDCYVAY